MKKGWKYGTLEDAVKKTSSNISLNKVKDDEGVYPLFSAKGFNKNISFFHQEQDYLAIIKDGAGIGRVSKHPAKSSVVATMQYLIPKEGFDIGFVEYFLNGIDFEKHRNGSTIPHIYFKDYKSEEFPILELPEQKRIVAILDRAFEAIDKAKANAEQNLKNAKELFESYLNSIFEEKGEDWEEKTLGELCIKIQDGAHHSPKKLYPNKEIDLFPYITSKNIRNNFMDLSKLQYVEKEFHLSIYPRCKPEISDVLLTKDGANTGNITLNTFDEPFSLLSSVCLIKPNKTKVLSSFIKYYIQSPLGFKKITGKMTGAAIKRIILKAIKSATMPLPPLETQKKIVQKLDQLQAETKKMETVYQKKIEDLEELKKSILQKAFSGELS